MEEFDPSDADGARNLSGLHATATADAGLPHESHGSRRFPARANAAHRRTGQVLPRLHGSILTRVVNLTVEESAKSASEYATIFGLIVMGVVVSAATLGDGIRSGLSGLSTALARYTGAGPADGGSPGKSDGGKPQSGSGMGGDHGGGAAPGSGGSAPQAGEGRGGGGSHGGGQGGGRGHAYGGGYGGGRDHRDGAEFGHGYGTGHGHGSDQGGGGGQGNSGGKGGKKGG